jgi:hypothetical protein
MVNTILVAGAEHVSLLFKLLLSFVFGLLTHFFKVGFCLPMLCDWWLFDVRSEIFTTLLLGHLSMIFRLKSQVKILSL